jgi:minor extracellular serine protease Vpr
VDVAAPGNYAPTAYAPKSYWATFRHNVLQGTSGTHGMASAVSAANPITTGVVALMLQANPKLDATQVRAILRQTARADSYTGAVPNATWGYGKLDALRALDVVNGNSPTPYP